MKNRKFKKGLAIVLALVMVFAMTATAFASTNGTATINFYIYDETEDTSWKVDAVSVSDGQSLYAALNTLTHYSPLWQTGTDVFNEDTIYYLTSFMDCPSNVNVGHQYNSDGSGWSIDWGWLYTVGENHVMPSFPNEPNHGMAMNQYTIESGDSIDVVYTLTRTDWDADYTTTYQILHPWY